MSSSRATLSPSAIGEYIGSGTCPRFAKLELGNTEIPSYKETPGDADWVAIDYGNTFEQTVFDKLEAEAALTYDEWSDYKSHEENTTKFVTALEQTATNPDTTFTFLKQPPLLGDVEAFTLAGEADVILMWPTDPLTIGIFDVKTATDERTSHQIQTACYSILVDTLLEREGIDATVTTGIIQPDTPLTTITPEALPRFGREVRENDVRRLLDSEGRIADVLSQSEDEIAYQHDANCYGCKFNEHCYTDSVESHGLELLDLTRGEQAALREYGFSCLEDVAAVIEPPENPNPTDFDQPPIRQSVKHQADRLQKVHAVGERLPRLAQEAQALLSKLNPEHQFAYDGWGLPWKIGSGGGSLPEDDVPFETDQIEFQQGTMVRVYLNVQHNHISDTIYAVGGYVEMGESSHTVSFGEMVSEFPEEHSQAEDVEASLLAQTAKNIFNAVRQVAAEASVDEAPVHIYTYTQNELSLLEERLAAHAESGSHSQSVEALYSLVTMRAGIDQQMTSAIQPEIESRFAPTQPSTGLLPILDVVNPYDGVFDTDDDWVVSRDGDTIDLSDAFKEGVFDYWVAAEADNEGITTINGDEADLFYPLRARFDSQLPLAYPYSVLEIEKLTPEWADESQIAKRIEAYRWATTTDGEDIRLSKTDIESITERFAQATAHVERSITYRNLNVTKDPFTVATIDQVHQDGGSLAQGCKEYLDLEYQQALRDTLSVCQKPLKQRIASGESLPLRVKSVEDKGYKTVIEAETIFDEFDFDSPQQVAASSKVGDSRSGSGDRMLATPIAAQGGEWSVQYNPTGILNNSPSMSVQLFDQASGYLRLESYYGKDKRYTSGRPKADPTPGTEFVLDPNPDDTTASHALEALENPEKNSIYNLFETNRTGVSNNNVETTTDVNYSLGSYLDWVKAERPFEPNTEQKQFITETDARVSTLQGPPGTGKTSGALAHALAGRAYAAHESDTQFRGAVTATSNTAIQEVLEDTAELVADCDHEALENTWLVSLVLEAPTPEDELKGVEYVNYHNDDAMVETLREKLTTDDSYQSTFGGPDVPPNIILFGTTARIRTFVRNMLGYTDSNIERLFTKSPNLFDALAVDEASMYPLPYLLLTASFVSDSGQLLVTGDQRQMPPIQSYEWEDELRETITKTVPYLSTLDYCRLLRGDDMDLPDEHEIPNPTPDAPFARTALEQTYRCHTDVATFLQEHIYSQDGIDYRSDVTETITGGNPTSPLTRALLDTEQALTVVLYEERQSQQSNPTEATLVRDILNALPTETDAGIVTPHNAQKGLLQSYTEENIEVDTVERFQGGERDSIIMSTTVSDPDYQQQEEDFLLNPNRLNVALSRMKHQLVVLLPASLFDAIPDDTDTYENSIIWRGLLDTVDTDNPSWDGKLEDAVSVETIPGTDTDTEIQILQQ